MSDKDKDKDKDKNDSKVVSISKWKKVKLLKDSKKALDEGYIILPKDYSKLSNDEFMELLPESFSDTTKDDFLESLPENFFLETIEDSDKYIMLEYFNEEFLVNLDNNDYITEDYINNLDESDYIDTFGDGFVSTFNNEIAKESLLLEIEDCHDRIDKLDSEVAELKNIIKKIMDSKE